MDIQRFRALFDGYQSAYGVLSDMHEDESGKMQGRNILIRSSLTDEHFKKHLDGSGPGLRMIPLKENNKLRYAAIDLDKKCEANPLKHTIYELEALINKLQLPLIPCQSKSGDIHLYCFAKEDIDARMFMNRIGQWATLLGYGGAEKFPKQTSRANDKDTGQALNLPYYDTKNTNRFAINKGKKLSLDEFLDYAEASRASIEDIRDFKYEGTNEDYDDAPPCLQMMATKGVNDGSRNNGLFSLAVYYKKKYPDNFEDMVQKANSEFFTPMLSLKEVESVIKSADKKDFFYKCNESPCVQLCNKNECYRRRYGIGNSSSGSHVVFDNLTKHTSLDSVRWYADLQGVRIQLTTEELFNQRMLQRKIADSTTKRFTPMKEEKWGEIIDGLFKTCVTIEDPEDASKQGQFKLLVIKWLNSKNLGSTKTDLVGFQGNYVDSETNKVFFRSPDLFTYLRNSKFQYNEQDVFHWLTGHLEGEKKTIRIDKNKTVACWSIPQSYINAKEDLI